jgi:hypothetical protein
VAAAKEGTTAPPDEEDVQPNPDAAPDAGEGAGAEDEEDEHGFNYSQRVDTSKFTVQVRIGPNGETIVDEQSLFVDRAGGEDDTAGYTHIEESDLTKFVNSMTHSKKAGGSRWSAEETELFFDVSFPAVPAGRRVDSALQALRQFGENYELLALVLPGRDRKACRNKFKAEDKRSTNRINWCLNNRLSYGPCPRFSALAGVGSLPVHRHLDAVTPDRQGLLRANAHHPRADTARVSRGACAREGQRARARGEGAREGEAEEEQDAGARARRGDRRHRGHVRGRGRRVGRACTLHI